MTLLLREVPIPCKNLTTDQSIIIDNQHNNAVAGLLMNLLYINIYIYMYYRRPSYSCHIEINRQ